MELKLRETAEMMYNGISGGQVENRENNEVKGQT